MDSWNEKLWKLAIRLPIIMAILAMIISCGNYNQTDNSENNGVADFILSITPEDDGGPTVQIDVVRDICDPGPPAVLEVFSDATASVELSYDPTAACDTSSALCPELYLKSYKVSWSSSDPAAVPIPSVNLRHF